MKYGYTRVSTDDQTPALQLAALKRAGCKTVFKDEGISGATTKRPSLLRCLKTLRAGDTLIIWKLDRLGRSLRDLITMLDDLRASGVKFRSLTEAIDTETPTGRAMWQMIGVLAELERSLISERARLLTKELLDEAERVRAEMTGSQSELSPDGSGTFWMGQGDEWDRSLNAALTLSSTKSSSRLGSGNRVCDWEFPS